LSQSLRTPALKSLATGLDTALGAQGLDHHGGRASGEPVAPEHPLQVVEVAGEELLGMLEHVLGYAMGLVVAGAGYAEAVGELVAPAVVGSAHLHDVLLARGQASHAD
jgi:hypothetical protein